MTFIDNGDCLAFVNRLDIIRGGVESAAELSALKLRIFDHHIRDWIGNIFNFYGENISKKKK